MSIMKVDKDKVEALADVVHLAISKHLEKTPMTAAEIQLALTQVIYEIGTLARQAYMEKALRKKPRAAA